MKQEAGKKTKKWLIPVIIALVLLLIGGGVAGVLLLGNFGGNQDAADPAGRADIYWNVDRQQFIDAATGLSIREPSEDGLYHMVFAFDGEQVELTVADKKLVNRIDMLDFMGLTVDGDGNVTDCQAAGDIATIAAENFFVQKQEGNVITTNSSAALNGMAVDYTVTENTGIYNVSALAEVVGQVDTVAPMDKVVVLQNGVGETTHIFIVERPVESDVYWRVGQYYANKETTRVPDENGVYSILFAVNGEQVTLKAKDKDVVTEIDAYDNNVQAMGLVFDDEGFIIDTMTSAMAVRGSLVSNQFDVTEVNGKHFKTQRMLPSSNQGQTWEGDMSENCKIYDVSGVSDFVGQEVDELVLDDRVYVLTNSTGEAEIIFITNRMLRDHDLYWLATRYYDNAAQTTTLKPAADGYWYMEFVIHGELVTLRSNDLDIVNQVQAPTTKAMGLDLDGDVITKVYHYVNITGGWVVAGSSYVDSINGPIVSTSYASGSTSTFVMAADCEVMNVCFNSPKVMGEYTTLQLDDRVVPIRNAQGEVVVVYVNLRKVDAPVYWSLNRNYDSTKKETTKTPLTEGEWAGYYKFRVTTGGGQPKYVYTKSKQLATKFDSMSPQAVGLKLSGSVITAVYGAGSCTGGGNMANYCHVETWENEEPDENGIMRFYAKYRATGNGTTVQYTKDTKIYNVSPAASYVGVPVSNIKLDDRITVFTNRYGIAEIIFIVEQPVYGEPYYNMDVRYNSKKGETSRQPNEEGYYVFDKIAYKGEIITLKTKNKDVATEVDSYSIGFYAHTSNGIVTRAFGIPNLANYGNNKGPNFDIVKISGRTLTLQRTRPSATNQGDTVTITMSSSAKFYDVSSYAEKPGAVVTPQVGDRVVIYQDNDNQVGKVGFVTMRHTREAGAFGLCEHCNEVVYWNHWEGAFSANANKEKDNDTVHYYLPSDRKLSQQVAAGNEKQTVMHAVLDLNGKTLESTSRALVSWYGATLYVMDSSKDQTGTVIGRGDPSNKDSAGVAFTTRGGSITIYGGTWKVAEEHNIIGSGGILNAFAHADFAGGTITINGGKFYGTDVTANGAVVSCNTGEIVINGGEFFGGTAGNIGGTVHSYNKLTINGGILHGGVANYGATVAVPHLIVNGGTIESGDAVSLGDCMYISSTYKAEINGGTIDSIWINSTWDQTKGYVKLTGAPVINNMDIASGKLIDATGVTGGTIAVNATGVFTTEFATEAAAKTALQYFTSSSNMGTVTQNGKQLAMGIYRCLYGHTPAQHESISCDQEIVTWSLWNENTKLPSTTGYFILNTDVTTANQTSIAGKDVVLDLNGHDVTYKIPTARTQNFRLYYVNDEQNSNGKTAGARPGSLIITDNSTSDVAQQGTVKSILPAYAANYADEPKWNTEAEAYAASQGLTPGTPEYDAAVAKYIEDLLAGYEKTHNAAASGMLVFVAHGDFALLGGNLDASNLTISNSGTAIATGARLDTMSEEAQNVLLLGGTVSAGATTRSGGAIFIAKGTTLTMADGVVNGGTLSNNAHGAAISTTDGTINIVGGTVNGGTGATNSGSVYAEGGESVVTIAGNAVINPGKATNGDAMYIRFGTWTIGGNAKVYGGVGVSKASLTVTGAPTIVKQPGGSEYSLKLVTSDMPITFTDLEDGAKIAITGTGKFSTVGDVDEMQAWINKGYFSAEAEGKAVVIQGGALAVADADAIDKVYCVYGHLNHDGIECDEPLLTWSKWESTTTLPTASGNYYLADNSTMTLANYTSIITTNEIQINLDLRGSTVLAPSGEGSRMLLLRASNDSCYTFTDTLDGAVMKTTATKLAESSMDGDLLYCYNGLIRLIDVDLDATSITENVNKGSAVYLANWNGYVGSFMAEKSTIIGGKDKVGSAIYNCSGCSVVLKDTTVIGGFFQEASAKNVHFVGDTKLLPGTTSTFGVNGTVAAAEFRCQELTENAELVVANCTYGFADEAAAQAAVDNGIIKAVEGMYLEVSGKIVKVLDQPAMYCVYGHTEHTGENADCAEPIVAWTKWTNTTTLPYASGNYYLPEGMDFNATSQAGAINTETVFDIKLDLRGNTVTATKDARLALIKGAAGSQYIITDTVGGAVMKTSVASSNISGGAAMLYANIGTIRVIGVEIDSTSITTNTQANSVALALATGSLILEDCTVKGGASSNGVAIYQNPASSGVNMTLKNTTVEGGIMVQGTATKTKLEGVVKLLPGNGTFGLKGTVAAAEFNCVDLAEGSQIVAANCVYYFGTAEKAQAAVANGVIVPVEGMAANINGAKVTIGEKEKNQYCVYGHESHEGVTCYEPILTWTKWEDTTKLPSTAGNYYVPAGTTITTTANLNVMSTEDVQINLDLRGGTVLAPNKDNMRLLLVRVGNNGGYTFTSTEGQAKIKTTTATLTKEGAINGGLFYCYNGLVRVINTDLDTTSLTDNVNEGSVAYLTNYNGYVGKFEVENSTITGGTANNSNAIYNNTGDAVLTNVTLNGGLQSVANATATGSVAVVDSTINGKVYTPGLWVKDANAYAYPVMSAENTKFTALVENSAVFTVSDCEFVELYHNATGANLKLSGVVKVPNMYTGHEDCAINCSNLETGSELVVSKGKYTFNTADAAQTAVSSGLLKAASGYVLDPQNETTYKVIVRVTEKTEYCIYGHETHEGVDCAEPILTWTKWETTNKLPTTSGNYYIPENSTVKITAQGGAVNTETVFNINLDLRGNTIEVGRARAVLLKGAEGSCYTIVDTTGGAKMVATEKTVDYTDDGAMLYANQGTIRLIGITVDASAIENNTNRGSVIYVLKTATLLTENCTLIGGNAKNGEAIATQLSSGSGDTTVAAHITLKNTTVTGGMHIQASAKYIQFVGKTKLVPGAYNNYGVKGTVDAAELDCTKLGANSEIVAFNCNYAFADETSAQNAVSFGNIKPAAGRMLTVTGTKVSAVEGDHCINGHTTTEECEAAGCDEEIVSWTKLSTTLTNLPKTAGYYYFPEGSNVKLEAQINTDANSGNIYIDLRGSTVTQTKKDARVMLVNGGANVMFLDSVGGGKLVYAPTDANSTTMPGAVLYAHTGTLTVRDNITIDSTAVTSSSAAGSVLFVNDNGNLYLDGVTVKGGAGTQGAIYCQGLALSLKNTTVETAQTGKGSAVYTIKAATLDNCTINGAVYNRNTMTIDGGEIAALLHEGGQANLILKGDVKIAHLELVNAEGWGKTDSLGANAELTIANASWGPFADVAAAQAAIDNGLLKPAAGTVLKAYAYDETGRVIANPLRCVYGHIAHEGETAECAEPIVEWTLLTASSTTKLPTTNGNYYFKDGAEINLKYQSDPLTTTTVYDIKVDLRGATVKVGNHRVLIMKGAAGSTYTITDTKGDAKIVATTNPSSAGNAPMIFANIGTIRVIDVDLDASAITSNTYTDSVVVNILAGGGFIAENCTITGAGGNKSCAIYHTPAADATVKNLVLKDTTVSGGVWVNGSALRVKLEGVVKLLAGNGTYGLQGAAAAAEFNCTALAEGSVIEAANCNFNFGTAEKAAAAANVVIKPIPGKNLTVNNSIITIS